MHPTNFAPIKDSFDKCLGSDRFNVTADGNTTLRWKRINALFVGSFKINRSDTRELNWHANAIRSSEKCSAVFQKYTVLTFRAAINVNCTVSLSEHPLPKILAVQFIATASSDRQHNGVFIVMCIRGLLLRAYLATFLLIGSQVWHAIINIRDQCQDSCHYHGSPNYARIRHIVPRRDTKSTRQRIVHL